jgi:antitoxin MazE
MESTVQKWGNSLGLRIPKVMADELGIQPGSSVTVQVSRHVLSVRKAPRPHPKAYKLTALLKGITLKNCHREIVSGEPVGNEVW